ncbi:tetratricopeptide repeat protein [Myxococcaceae bacterium GXIMD 01537]
MAGLPARAVEVDAAVSLPVAFAGLRKVLQALAAHAPEVMKDAARRRPAEWNRLFPGSVAGVADLADLALTPSERRLHRESEQVLWVLNVAARAVLDALRESGRTLVVRRAGACDLVSLRGLMRAVECSRLEPGPCPIVFSGWGWRGVNAARLFEQRRRGALLVLRERMRLESFDLTEGGTHEGALEPALDPEGAYLRCVVDGGLSAERRVAAALLAVRACFFSSNYEGTLLAAEQGLRLLDASGASFSPGRVESEWDSLDAPEHATPAVEIDRGSLGEVPVLRALLLRSIGVVQVYTGEHDAAMESFGRGLECRVGPEGLGQLRMFRALTRIKRMGQVALAREELEAGLSPLEGRDAPDTRLQEGWLRNVLALTCFQEKKLEAALEEEKRAMRCVRDLHDPSATHLKINLISNVSVLQETARQLDDAITTWRRFERISSQWGTNFLKHHRYRLGGLQLGAGQREEAGASYAEAYTSAATLGDHYHQQSIAAELGRLHLDEGRHEEARQWFQRALDSAREVGEPLRVAESLAGAALAAGQAEFGEALRAASADSTHPAVARKLAEALARGDGAATQALLPGPRSKLNRPFDLVNL